MLKNSEKSRVIFSIVFRTAALLVGLFGIFLHMSVNSLLDTGFMVKHNLAYFTLQTNIFSVIIFAVLLIKTIYNYAANKQMKVAHINASVHLACTMYITITMAAYWLVLTPFTGIPQNAILFWDSFILHGITPCLAIIDTLLFFEHGSVKKKEIPKWLIYPVIYYISVIIISKLIKEPYYSFNLGGKTFELMYPYPFLDPSFMGIGGTVLAVCMIVIFFILFSLLYIHLDSKIKSK